MARLHLQEGRTIGAWLPNTASPKPAFPNTFSLDSFVTFLLDHNNRGDINKFSSVPKLVAYSGIYPTSRQSGESKTDGHMSNRGSPYLRRAIWLTATVAAFKDPALSRLTFYSRSLQ